MTEEQLQALQAQIAQLQSQQALQTEALRAFLEGRLEGEGSAEAYLLALNPTLTVDPAPFLFGEEADPVKAPLYLTAAQVATKLGLSPSYCASSSGKVKDQDLVLVHGSRSGNFGNPSEGVGTVRYCWNPVNQASYNHLIDYDGTIYELTGWEASSWHATYLNARAWAVCLAQPTVEDVITDQQHESLRWMMHEYANRFGVPLVHVLSENARGFIEHRETAQGASNGKSDVGYKLNWDRLLGVDGG